MPRMMELCSLNQALIIEQVDIGKIEVGYKADMVIFDEKISKKIEDKTSLYRGDTLYGEVKYVFKNGEVVES
jgi:dihydroorotase